MTPEIKQNEDNWQQTISAFHTYLQQTVEMLAQRPEITKVDMPSSQNPRIAASRKQTKLIPEGKISNPVPLVSADKAQVAKPSTRRYSSPLWVGLGDDQLVQSHRKTMRKGKTK